MRQNTVITKIFYKDIPSPVGTLRLVANDNALIELLYGSGSVSGEMVSRHPILDKAEVQLGEYFAGKRKKFDLPLATEGSPFQKKVWSALCKIPYGKTRTYGEIAKKIKQPKAVRAVGGDNNKNPLAIVVPCHRVVGSSGHLTGYAGGLMVKEKLLALEAAHSENQILRAKNIPASAARNPATGLPTK